MLIWFNFKAHGKYDFSTCVGQKVFSFISPDIVVWKCFLFFPPTSPRINYVILMHLNLTHEGSLITLLDYQTIVAKAQSIWSKLQITRIYYIVNTCCQLVPAIILSTLCILTRLILTRFLGASAIITCILQIRKVRLREIKQFAQGQTASELQSQDSNLGTLALESALNQQAFLLTTCQLLVKCLILISPMGCYHYDPHLIRGLA